MSLAVAHVIGGGDTGGAMAHVLPLLSALRAAGCDSRLLCLGDGGLADAAVARQIPLEVVPMGSPWDVRVLGPLYGRLVGGGFDVVHTHGMRANLPVRLLWPCVRRAAAPGRRPCLFTTVHSDLTLDYADRRRVQAYLALDRLTLPVVDQIVYVSAELRGRATGSRRAGGVVVIRSGVELRHIPPETRAAAGTSGSRARPDIAAAVWHGEPPAVGVPRVGTVARLVPVKDLSLLLDVAARLRRTLPLRVAVIGDGPERDRLEAGVAERGLDGVVTLAGDVRPGSEAVRELDVFLLTSRSEGIPVAVLEAMAAGIPVVATAVGGMAEAVEQGVTGFLVPRPDGPSAADAHDQLAAALAERVTSLLLDADLRARLGDAGRRRVRECFSADAAARATIRAYERCLVAKRAATGVGKG